MSSELENFRAKIDAYDDQIIQLLKDRLHVVSEVAAYKRANFPNQFPIRAGREARMLRRIAQVFKGTDFAPAAAAQLWRIIIGTSTALEQPLTVSVFAPDDKRDLYWLTREYFGPAALITRQPHVKRVIGDVMDGKAAIGVVPTLHNPEGTWWSHMLRPEADAPKFFAHLPFVYTNENPKLHPAGLAFSRIAPEASGDDVSVYVLELDHDVSQHRIQTALAGAHLSANWLGVESPTPNTRQHIIEVKGFVPPEQEAMQHFLASFGASLKQSYFLGAYAQPITIQD